MTTNLLRKTLSFALIASVGSLLISGCSQTPVVAPVAAPVVLSPAELYLSSEGISTYKDKEIIERYDLTVKVNNTDGASAYINLENKGDEPLFITKVEFLNNNDKLFSTESACGNQVMPEKSCQIKVTFNGKYEGRYTSDIQVETNSYGRYVGKVGKIHIIANADNRLKGLITAINSSKNVQKKPMAKLFFNNSKLVQYAQLKNNGIDDITIAGYELIGADKKNFSFTQECPDVLKVGQSCELKVTYKKKWDTSALSYLVVKSNGILFPSDTIRLSGTPTIDKYAPQMLQLAGNDDMKISMTKVETTKNIQNFLEDFSAVKPVYYFRTMYQGNTNTQFKEYYEEIVKYYFAKNNFKTTTDASKADKILNIYPSIDIFENGKGAMKIVANIKSNIVTKSIKDIDTNTTVAFDMEIEASEYSDAYFVYNRSADKINSFMFNLLGLEE